MYIDNDELAVETINNWKAEKGFKTSDNITINSTVLASLQCHIVDALQKKDLERIKLQAKCDMFEASYKYVSMLNNEQI